jgi:hypothetical protein
VPKATGNVKICSTCRNSQSLDAFQKNRHRPDGLHSQCRSCVSAAGRAWRERNPEQKKATNRRWAEENAERTFNATWGPFGFYYSDYLAMLEAQGGVCAICHESCRPGRRLSVDHCHATGRIRGLLCDWCNRGLGLFRDSPESLLRAERYLDK